MRPRDRPRSLGPAHLVARGAPVVLAHGCAQHGLRRAADLAKRARIRPPRRARIDRVGPAGRGAQRRCVTGSGGVHWPVPLAEATPVMDRYALPAERLDQRVEYIAANGP